jgi:pyruvate dehydrogenase E2 component (dihydrolipoamide acetyltransferase)
VTNGDGGIVVATLTEVLVPDLGDFKDVPVIEVLVKPGDRVSAEDPLITLESDKATMDVPAPAAGVVKELIVKVGDKVSEGSRILVLDAAVAADEPGAPAAARPPAPGLPRAAVPAGSSASPAVPASPTEARPGTTTPSQAAPTAASSPPLRPVPRSAPSAAVMPGASAPSAATGPPVTGPPSAAATVAPAGPAPPVRIDEAAFARAHASPSVRRFARELGVDLGNVRGSGPHDRILKEDVQRHVKDELARPRAAARVPGTALPEPPVVDFAKFGPVETRALTRIQKLSGPNLHRSWLLIPHVTQHDEADITDLEDFRKSMSEEARKQGFRLTLLAFLLKASVAALEKHPDFNSSLAPGGDALILRRYFNIGVAVDTPEGLVVPVIRNVDGKGVFELARELGEVSAKARDKKLAMADLQGGCFTISSLGGIGGTAFTPVINLPEVAILGVSRSSIRPVWKDGGFVPRLMLPLSLSYDHRVIDGAAAARFITYLASVLSDMRRALL